MKDGQGLQPNVGPAKPSIESLRSPEVEHEPMSSPNMIVWSVFDTIGHAPARSRRSFAISTFEAMATEDLQTLLAQYYGLRVKLFRADIRFVISLMEDGCGYDAWCDTLDIIMELGRETFERVAGDARVLEQVWTEAVKRTVAGSR